MKRAKAGARGVFLYLALVQQGLDRAFCRAPVAASDPDDFLARVWISSTGEVQRAELLPGTGIEARDRVYIAGPDGAVDRRAATGRHASASQPDDHAETVSGVVGLHDAGARDGFAIRCRMSNSADVTLLRQMLVSEYDDLRRRLTRRLGSEGVASEVLQETYLHLERSSLMSVIDSPEALSADDCHQYCADALFAANAA